MLTFYLKNKDLFIIFNHSNDFVYCNQFSSHGVSIIYARFFLFFLSICIDFSLEGFKFISVRQYSVLPSLNKDSACGDEQQILSTLF